MGIVSPGTGPELALNNQEPVCRIIKSYRENYLVALWPGSHFIRTEAKTQRYQGGVRPTRCLASPLPANSILLRVPNPGSQNCLIAHSEKENPVSCLRASAHIPVYAAGQLLRRYHLHIGWCGPHPVPVRDSGLWCHQLGDDSRLGELLGMGVGRSHVRVPEQSPDWKTEAPQARECGRP